MSTGISGSDPPLDGATTKQLNKLAEVLASNSEDWKARSQALEALEKLVCDSLDNGGPTQAARFGRPFIAMAAPLSVQLTDLRSELVRQAAQTISYLAEALSEHFTRCANKLVPAIVQVMGGTNKVIANYATGCAEIVLTNVHSPIILQFLQAEIKATKSKMIRQSCFELLHVALAHWPLAKYSRSIGSVEEDINLGLRSAAPATRVMAAKCFWLLSSQFPDRRERFLAALDARTRKVVESHEHDAEEKDTPVSRPTLSVSTPSSSRPSSSHGHRTPMSNRSAASSASSSPLAPPSPTAPPPSYSSITPHGTGNGNGRNSAPSTPSVSGRDHHQRSFAAASVAPSSPISSATPVAPAIGGDHMSASERQEQFLRQLDTGTRVVLEKHAGRIQYMGSMQGRQGEWVGIEMDEKVGESNGTVDGVTYFVSPPKRALFTRRHLLQAEEDTLSSSSAALSSNSSAPASPVSSDGHTSSSSSSAAALFARTFPPPNTLDGKTTSSTSSSSGGPATSRAAVSGNSTGGANGTRKERSDSGDFASPHPPRRPTTATTSNHTTSSSTAGGSGRPPPLLHSQSSTHLTRVNGAASSTTSHAAEPRVPLSARHSTSTHGHGASSSVPPASASSGAAASRHPTTTTTTSVRSKIPLSSKSPATSPSHRSTSRTTPNASPTSGYSGVDSSMTSSTRRTSNQIQSSQSSNQRSSAPSSPIVSNTTPHHTTASNGNNGNSNGVREARAFSFDMSKHASGDSERKTTIEADKAILVRDHRQHVSQTALHLQKLNSVLNNQSSNNYTDEMIVLLVDQLDKTQRLLSSYQDYRRRTHSTTPTPSHRGMYPDSSSTASLPARPASSPPPSTLASVSSSSSSAISSSVRHHGGGGTNGSGSMSVSGINHHASSGATTVPILSMEISDDFLDKMSNFS